MFPIVQTADELAKQETETALASQPQTEDQMSSLAGRIRSDWEKAKKAKETIAKEMLESLRQRNGEYSPEKLAAIRKIRSAEVYMKLTNTKCRSLEAWIREIEFQSGQKCWDIEPTPDPELPPEIASELKQKFYREATYQLLMNSMMSGQQMDTMGIVEKLHEMIPEFDTRLEKLILEKAKEAAEEMAKEIDDQLTEGGFYQALDDCIYDICTLKAAILKGPIPRKEKVRNLRTNPATGILEVFVEEKNLNQYERVSPFDIFPFKDSSGINDGGLLERGSYRPDQLSGMLDIPSGYNQDQIRAVLTEAREIKLSDWVTSVDYERAIQEKQQKDGDIYTDTTKIPYLLWWGAVDGKTLIDEGITQDKDGKPLDPVRYYHATAWLIGTHVIKSMLNPDPNGEKPYSKASAEMIPGAFWGKSPPEIIADIQTICNAVARAIVNNVAIASGPQVEAIKDRFPDDYDFTLWAWKVWQSEESQVSDKPALNFYQPPMVVDKLINVYMTFNKIADDHFGVPGFAHGDSQVGGAGNTASGLSMLLGGASRGVKDIIQHMDRYLIGPTVVRQFYWNIEHNPKRGVIGDLKVVPRGTSYLVTKTEQAMRMLDFVRATGNDVDLAIEGTEGRRYLLKQASKNLVIDPEKAFPENAGPINPMMPANVPPANNMGGPTTVGPDGKPAQGVDTRMFNQEGK